MHRGTKIKRMCKIKKKRKMIYKEETNKSKKM